GKLKLDTVANILDKLDILIVPVVNRERYDVDQRGCKGVDLNRDFPVLWNGQRYDAEPPPGWTDYYHNGDLPNGWTAAQPGLGTAPADRKETQAIMKLMRKKIDAFVDF